MWFNASCVCQNELPRWKEGDIVGCFIDIDNRSIVFSLNGVQLNPFNQVFQNIRCASDKKLFKVYHNIFFPSVRVSFLLLVSCHFNNASLILDGNLSNFLLKEAFSPLMKWALLVLVTVSFIFFIGFRTFCRREANPSETNKACCSKKIKCKRECLYVVFWQSRQHSTSSLQS